MRASISASMRRATAVAALVGSVGCVDEKIVYRDGPNFAAPPQAAASFIGYDDAATKLTVCGNCHVGQQGKWATTAHAGAWKTLNDNAGKRGTCEACHTVSNLGNIATDTAVGWRSTKDARYQDVQCESCHGAGLQHVGTPARGQMLASTKAEAGATVTNGCGECHTGTHHPFVEDWLTSRHSTPRSTVFNSATSTPPAGETVGGPRGACQSCHVGQKVLEAWGVNTNYAEKAAAINCAQTRVDTVRLGPPVETRNACTGTSTAFGQNCIVCHDPHGSSNRAQLRFPVDSRDPELNLCVKCHNRRGNFDLTQTNTSPHAPHGPLVLGTAGWWPAGLNFEESESSHGTDRNPKLCAQCHVQQYNVTDKATNAFVVTVTGHRFSAIPCVDANGRPTDQRACTQVSQRSFKSCAGSGCHSETSARTAYIAAEADIALLRGALNTMLASPLIPATQKTAGVTTYRGSLYNYNLAGTHGAEAHNPLLVKALLRASIAQVNKDYGVALPPGLSIAPYDKLILGRAN